MNWELNRCTSWVSKRQRNQRANCQHSLDHGESKGVPQKQLLPWQRLEPLIVWITTNCGKFLKKWESYAYFVNKVLLEHSEACSLICSLWLFSHTTMAGLSSHSKKHMAHQEWNIYHLAIYRKSWPTPTLPIEPAFLRFPDDNITGVC